MKNVFSHAEAPVLPDEFSIRAEDVHVVYGENAVLRGATLTVDPGEYVAIVGKSGHGKTTLLETMAGTRAEPPESGEVYYDNCSIYGLSRAARTILRSRHIGIVPQAPNLDVDRTAWDNITIPLKMRSRHGVGLDNALVSRASEILEIGNDLHKRPPHLSVGQQQRVSVLRSLAANPSVLMMDEPTSALDAELGHEMNKMLATLARELGKTIITVTHEDTLAPRIVALANGRVASDAKYDELPQEEEARP